MKEYTKPLIEEEIIVLEDIIAASGDVDDINGSLWDDLEQS